MLMLTTTRVEDVDRWLEVFANTSAATRKQHGSKGATSFRDPTASDRVWVLFDWDEKGRQSFVSDPEVAPILKAAGHRRKPRAALLLQACEA